MGGRGRLKSIFVTKDVYGFELESKLPMTPKYKLAYLRLQAIKSVMMQTNINANNKVLYNLPSKMRGKKLLF